MKPTRIGFGVGLLIAASFPVFAQAPNSQPQTIEETTSVALPEAAVPRPIPQLETIAAPPSTEAAFPRPIEGEAIGEDPKVKTSGADKPPVGQQYVKDNIPSRVLPPGWEPWDGRQVSILGVDRTEFPEVMVVFGLRDTKGAPVKRVDPKWLVLTEDEAPQKIEELAPCVPEKIPGEPLNLMMLMDSSGSMQEYIDVVQTAAVRFVEKFRDDDAAGVVGFCDRPVVLEELTTKKKSLTKGIYSMVPRGFTALYDSVYLGVNMLSQAPGRRAIVLVTDGKDDDGTGRQLSRRKLDDVIEAARKNYIPIFVIGIGDEISHRVLERLGGETSGDFLFAPSGAEVDGLYEDVARMLGRGDEGYYLARYRASQSGKDGTERTVIVNYRNFTDKASYPAPTQLFWPLSKVVD